MNWFRRFLTRIREPSAFLKLVKAMPVVPEPEKETPDPPRFPAPTISSRPPAPTVGFGYGRPKPDSDRVTPGWVSVKKDETDLKEEFLIKLFSDGYEVRGPTREEAEEELQTMVETLVEEYLKELGPKHQSYLSTYRSWCWQQFRDHATQVERQFMTIDPKLGARPLIDVLEDHYNRGNGTAV